MYLDKPVDTRFTMPDECRGVPGADQCSSRYQVQHASGVLRSAIERGLWQECSAKESVLDGQIIKAKKLVDSAGK